MLWDVARTADAIDQFQRFIWSNQLQWKVCWFRRCGSFWLWSVVPPINIILYHLFFVTVSALIQASMHNPLIRYYNVANSSLILWHTHLYLRLKKSLVPFGWVLFLVCTPRTVTKQINITRILAGHVRCTRKHGTTSVVGNITIWYIHYTPHYSPATDSEHVRCRFVALPKCLFLS